MSEMHSTGEENSGEIPVSPAKAIALAELARLDWTRNLSAETLRKFGELAEFVDYQHGLRLTEFGTPLTHVYFVVTGKFKTTIFDEAGKRIQDYPITRGGVVGLFSLAAYDRSPISVEALEYSTTFRLTLSQLLKFSSEHPDFHLAILRLGSEVVKQVVTVERSLPKEAIVGVIHLSRATRPLALRIAKRLQGLGETIAVAGDDAQWAPDASIPHRLVIENGKPIESDERELLLREWSAYNRLLVDIQIDHFSEELFRMLGTYAQSVLLCVTPDQAALATKILRQAEKLFPALPKKTQLVWVIKNEEAVPPYSPDLFALVHRDFKLSFTKPKAGQSQLLFNGFERLIHYLRGVQIGLALGGGAARGMAHLGVLRAFEEQGIFVDRLAGTSAGAMTGTVYAAGMDPAYATHCFKTDLEPSWFFKKLPGCGYWYLLHQYRRNLFDPMLRKYIHDYRMEQLAIPMTTMAVDLVEGGPLTRTTGDATHNILESINLPPLSLPIFQSGQAVVDGGLLNNVPANILVSQGCNFVIASTVTAKLEKEFMGVRATGKPTISRFFSTIQVILRQSMIQNYNMNSLGVQPADVVIAPDVTSFDLSAFTRADEMAEIGYAAAMAMMPQLKAQLASLDSKLFGTA